MAFADHIDWSRFPRRVVRRTRRRIAAYEADHARMLGGEMTRGELQEKWPWSRIFGPVIRWASRHSP